MSTTSFSIEKQIPIPGKYPFDDMDVGDSFFIPPHIRREGVNVAALRYTKTPKGLNKRFTIRKVPDGFRCWRMA